MTHCIGGQRTNGSGMWGWSEQTVVKRSRRRRESVSLLRALRKNTVLRALQEDFQVVLVCFAPKVVRDDVTVRIFWNQTKKKNNNILHALDWTKYGTEYYRWIPDGGGCEMVGKTFSFAEREIKKANGTSHKQTVKKPNTCKTIKIHVSQRMIRL